MYIHVYRFSDTSMKRNRKVKCYGLVSSYFPKFFNVASSSSAAAAAVAVVVVVKEVIVETVTIFYKHFC